jgi:hypothetical protein
MTKKIFKSVLFVGTTIALLSFDLPKDWFKAGSNPQSYDMGIDKGAGQDGKSCATIKSIHKKVDGFGTLMQDFVPEKYLGKRVRMSGLMKSKDVNGWAGLWLRVDQANSQKALSFDNMQDRAIKGTTDWKKYEIVLDVPQQASNIAFGALLDGTGQVWFSNLSFEIVDTSVPRTVNDNIGYSILKEPSNLNFEE